MAISLRLLSWNVHGLPGMRNTPRRLLLVGQLVVAEQPDFVLLQEVWLGRYVQLFAETAGRDYELLSTPRRPFGWPSGGLLVLLRRDSGWQPQAQSFHRFGVSAPRRRVNEGDGLGGKGFLRIDLARGAERLSIIDTHLQSQYGPRLYEPIRRAQLEQLAAHLRQTDAAAAPTIVAGDLNTFADEDLYRSHVAPLGHDLFAEERERLGLGSHFSDDGRHQGWIDYILARNWSPRVRLRRFESDAADDPWSDHDGLWVET